MRAAALLSWVAALYGGSHQLVRTLSPVERPRPGGTKAACLYHQVCVSPASGPSFRQLQPQLDYYITRHPKPEPPAMPPPTVR